MSIGASVFKRTRGGKPDARYSIEIRMPDGTKRYHAGFTDKQATKQLAAQLVRELERKEVGLCDAFGTHRKAPILDHLEAFLTAMQNGTLARRRIGKPTAGYVETARRRLTDLFRTLGAGRLEHLVQGEAEKLLLDRVREGWSDKTRDDHAALLRQFGSWLVDDLRWATNPFHRMRPTHNQASKTFRRHALTVRELEQLIAAAETRGVQQYASANPWATPEHMADLQALGDERALLYQVAAYTGLRRGELHALVWGDLLLGDAPAIDVRASTQKTKQRVRLELPRWLGELLGKHRAAKGARARGPVPSSAKVFSTSYRHITEQMKLDAVWAGLGRAADESGRVLTADGLVIDLHSLRGSLATLAAELGMPPRLLQQHMRHSNIRLTMEVYAQVRSTAMRTEVERLPRPGQGGSSAPASAEVTPTVADDCRPRPDAENRKETGT